MKIIEKVALAVIQDKKVLFARSKKNQSVFYTLGGKIEKGETDEECIFREVKEEVDTTIQEGSLVFLGVVHASAHDKPNTQVRVRLYQGQLLGSPKPSSEVAEIAFFDTSMPDKNRSELGDRVINFLYNKGYIE